MARTVFHSEDTEIDLINQIMRGWYTDRLEGGKGKKIGAVLDEVKDVRNDILELKIALGQLTAIVQAMTVTIGERNHESGKRSEEDEYGLCRSSSESETASS